MSGGVFATLKTPAESSSVKVTLLRCKSTGRVLFLEAGKDFVDTLISFLTLPLGTVIKLILSQGNQATRIGGISNIFESVEKLSKSLLHVDRTTVTNPRPSSGFQQTLLHLDAGVDHKPVTKYYPCTSRQNCKNISSVATDQCPSCSQQYPGTSYGFNARDPLNVVSSTPAQKSVPKKGYVKKNLTYIVTDDLELLPTSTIKCIDVINKMSVESMADLESKEITISHTQVLQLLQALVSTKSLEKSDCIWPYLACSELFLRLHEADKSQTWPFFNGTPWFSQKILFSKNKEKDKWNPHVRPVSNTKEM